ncbi:MAG: C4-dicarboxylate ABC transporter [Meiothermus sp.]
MVGTVILPKPVLPSSQLAWPLQLVRGFTPNWFTVTMGTGIVALLLPKLPWPVLSRLGEGLWWLNLGLFTLFALLSLVRLGLFPTEARATLHHPLQSMFLGAIPMGFATLVNGLVVYGPERWGAISVGVAYWAWCLDAVVAAAVGLLVPYVMFTRHEHRLERMTAVWLLPIVAGEVAAVSAGTLLPHLEGTQAQTALWVGYVLWALSVPLALSILALLFLRLALHRLPPPELGVSGWLALGPLGTGALGLLLLGQAAPAVLSGTPLAPLGIVAKGIGLVGGLVLWGYGLWWWLIAMLKTRYLSRRGGLPFNLGWWGFTFPLGVYAAATFALAGLTAFAPLQVLAELLTLLLVGLWAVVMVQTLRGVWVGHLFHVSYQAVDR